MKAWRWFVELLQSAGRGAASVARWIFGALFMLASVGAVLYGLYIDIVVLLVGGITQITNGVTADPANGSMIGWGVVRVLFAGIGFGVGVIIAVLLFGVGTWLMTGTRRYSRRYSWR